MARQARFPERSLCCLVLAAGGSSRLGQPKQLLRRGTRTLLLDICTIAQAIAPGRTIVVLGAHALRLRRMLSAGLSGLSFVNNSAWRNGMGGSLLAGLARVPPGCGAVLVLLCDQPAVSRDALTRLLAQWRRRPRHAAAARYGGRIGVPAVLPRRLWHELKSGDRGARDILRAQQDLTIVDLPEAALDLDTPEDVERWQQCLRTFRRPGPSRS